MVSHYLLSFFTYNDLDGYLLCGWAAVTFDMKSKCPDCDRVLCFVFTLSGFGFSWDYCCLHCWGCIRVSVGVSRHVSHLETVSRHGFSCLGLGSVSTLSCLGSVSSFRVLSCLMSHDCVLTVSLSVVANWLFCAETLPPLPSNRHHRSCGDRLEGKGENYQACSVQYCVQQLCTVWCTHIWTD